MTSSMFVSSTIGTVTENGTISVDVQYDNTLSEDITLTFTVTDSVCTQSKTFNFVFTPNVQFYLVQNFVCAATGGCDGTINEGIVNLSLQSILSNYTIVVKVDNVVQNSVLYSVTAQTGTNYHLEALNLGSNILCAGIKTVRIEVTNTVTSFEYVKSYFTTACN